MDIRTEQVTVVQPLVIERGSSSDESERRVRTNIHCVIPHTSRTTHCEHPLGVIQKFECFGTRILFFFVIAVLSGFQFLLTAREYTAGFGQLVVALQ